jgi:membrane protein
VLLVAAPVLIGFSMSLTTYLVTLSLRVASVPPEAGSVLIRGISASMSALAFFLMYRIVPHRSVPWRLALFGGVVAAILFEAAKELFAAYVRYVPTYNVIYGTFALVPIFLIWVYVSWLVVLFGAELTACLESWPSERWKRALTSDVRFSQIMAVGRRLVEAQGEGLSVERLRMDTGIARRELVMALERMEKEGWILREAGLVRFARDPRDITLGALYEGALEP